jgi:hypothetical protein
MPTERTKKKSLRYLDLSPVYLSGVRRKRPLNCRVNAQSYNYFDKVKSDSDVTSRVPKWIKSKTETCLVVGVMVCEDVEVEWTSEEKRDAEGHVTRPIGTIALAAGAPLPPGTDIDP